MPCFRNKRNQNKLASTLFYTCNNTLEKKIAITKIAQGKMNQTMKNSKSQNYLFIFTLSLQRQFRKHLSPLLTLIITNWLIRNSEKPDFYRFFYHTLKWHSSSIPPMVQCQQFFNPVWLPGRETSIQFFMRRINHWTRARIADLWKLHVWGKTPTSHLGGMHYVLLWDFILFLLRSS